MEINDHLEKHNTQLVNDKAVEIYKILISDEHYYRQTFQQRVAYHTSILISLLGVIALGSTRIGDRLDWFVLCVASYFVSWLSIHSKQAVRRIYLHFKESLAARESLEIFLGLRSSPSESKNTSIIRDLNTNSAEYLIQASDCTAERYWPLPIFTQTWLGTRDDDIIPGGYYARTKNLFNAFHYLSYCVGTIFLVVFISQIYLIDLHGVTSHEMKSVFIKFLSW